jgi:IS30 family transposase
MGLVGAATHNAHGAAVEQIAAIWLQRVADLAERGAGVKGRCLSFAEREEIALARARGETMRAIARRLGRSPSTVSRELRRNADRRGYRATTAHALAYERASRPKPAKLQTNLALRRIVQDDLQRRFSPEQIAGRLRRRFPEDRPGGHSATPYGLRFVAAGPRAEP